MVSADILSIIFTYLPLEDLKDVALVNKEFLQIIRSDSYWVQRGIKEYGFSFGQLIDQVKDKKSFYETFNQWIRQLDERCLLFYHSFIKHQTLPSSILSMPEFERYFYGMIAQEQLPHFWEMIKDIEDIKGEISIGKVFYWLYSIRLSTDIKKLLPFQVRNLILIFRKYWDYRPLLSLGLSDKRVFIVLAGNTEPAGGSSRWVTITSNSYSIRCNDTKKETDQLEMVFRFFTFQFNLLKEKNKNIEEYINKYIATFPYLF